MAELTTVGGETLLFDPKGMMAVCDGYPGAGVGTIVLGLNSHGIKITEKPLELLNRLGILAKYIKVTRPAPYEPAWIRAESVKLVTPREPGTITNSELYAGGIQFGAMETVAEIRAALNSAGITL